MSTCSLLWSGEPVTHHGEHFQLDAAVLRPVVGGRDRRPDTAAELDYLAQLREAGATWWHEFLPPTTPEADTRALIAAGPLRPAPA